MAIRIITDSTCDFPTEMQETMGIDILPLSVFFGDDEYFDGITMKTKEFYEKLATVQILPKTSQINPDTFEKTFRKYIEQGDEIIGIFISSALSGTYQSADIAKSIIASPDIHLIDSKSGTFAMQILINEAVRLRDLGASAAEIVEKLHSIVPKIRIMAIVHTLKYLKMGGRISASSAMIGGVLGINPIVSVVDGKIESIGKVRGKDAGYKFLFEEIKKELPSKEFPISLGHSNDIDSLLKFKELVEKEYPGYDNIIGEIGSVIGAHLGPKCIGIAYIAE